MNCFSNIVRVKIYMKVTELRLKHCLPILPRYTHPDRSISYYTYIPVRRSKRWSEGCWRRGAAAEVHRRWRRDLVSKALAPDHCCHDFKHCH